MYACSQELFEKVHQSFGEELKFSDTQDQKDLTNYLLLSFIYHASNQLCV